MPLPPSPRYFPPGRGRYTTTPDLRPLLVPGENGAIDTHLFQLTDDFPRFRENTLAARRQWPGRHVLFDDFDPITAAAVCERIVAQLIAESPEWFVRDGDTLHCRLTDERLHFDADYRLRTPSPYNNLFDALAAQVSEDLVVVRRSKARGDWNAALHVCAPSHWAPEEKVGRDYRATHAPVPGVERSRAAAPVLVQTMVTRGPFVRFTWGIAFDDRLNCHPALPKTVFDGENVWLRVERQVLWPLPPVDAALFAIRLYLTDARTLGADDRAALRQALLSMSDESRRYKGLESSFDAVLAALS
jgi:hypothetical protein